MEDSSKSTSKPEHTESPEPELQRPTVISLRDKLFNTTTIMIPHLESIVLDKTDHSSHYRVISKCLLEQLGVLKKRLLVVDAAVERKEQAGGVSSTGIDIFDEWRSSQTTALKGSGKKVAKYAEIFGVPVHFLTEGEFNHGEIEKVLDYMETYMFYPAFKKWRAIATRTSLAKRMLVFLRKLDLVMNVCIPMAMLMPKDDLMSLPRDSPEWRELDGITTYINVFSEEKSCQLHTQCTQ